MPFSALQCGEMFAERPFCLFSPGEVFLEHCKNSLDFQILIFLFRKTVNFGLFVLFFDRKPKNTENGKSTKRNLIFVKRRNGGLSSNPICGSFVVSLSKALYYNLLLSTQVGIGLGSLSRRLATLSQQHYILCSLTQLLCISKMSTLQNSMYML